MGFYIKPEKTAITTGISNSARLLVGELGNQNEKSYRILDYGAGKLRNTKYIEQAGIVDILDTPTQIRELKNKNKLSNYRWFTTLDNLPKNTYDAILCSFVLNVISNIEDRKQVISNIYNALKPNGKAYFEVRTPQDLKYCKYLEACNDGYIVGTGNVRTFQKGFTQEDVLNLVGTKQVSFCSAPKARTLIFILYK